MDAVDRLERRRIVGEYVRERLVAEIGQSRGNALKIAKHTGFSAAHISNIKDGHRNVGDTFAMTMADYWGMTYSQLERLALERLAVAFRRGDAPASFPVVPAQPHEEEQPTDRLPQLTAVLAECDEEFYPKSFLREYERVARKSPQDRPKSVWLADLEVKYWDWRQRSIHSKDKASVISMEGDLAEAVSDAEPSSQRTDRAAAPEESVSPAGSRVRRNDVARDERQPRARRG